MLCGGENLSVVGATFSFKCFGREGINSGLDYWNGGIVEWWNSGMVDWSVFVLVFIIYHIVSTLQIILHLSSICIPRF